ncbi:ATP-dependent helicase HrpB [Marinomonas pollencensis]|uniref:ATP-dependent helicase HrpB n=1 Tax=Marinomonas pollencensis TaxID=491954 RepID=A0A3E0D9U5_9GAMM|nr:ATP-dependent helicase HrpB [Marinomonas pollencensis]REG79344.1 ATP-dependent helicase HrpB [Marinomonas pollencensis]
MSSSLPIYDLIPTLKAQLNQSHEAILEAAPGAGKTTVVPLELMNEAWRQGRQILMLEPRRLAAKTAAKRLADSLQEPLGKRVGYRIRHEGKESNDTQLLVVTEGVLTRMLQDDPSLDNIALVIFDEFHERNLHSDLAFALCLQARELYRDDDPLKLLVMSATLDTALLESRLGCPTLTSHGRGFPIETHYANKSLKTTEVVDEVVRLTYQAYREHTGSILVFLPGQKEIRQAATQLQQRLGSDPEAKIRPLYGELSLKEQEAVIQPAIAPERKIVLATAIAQTSLTIDGIRIVIDSGLSREARFDANTATTRLHTRRATQAETTQRMGRAGRTEAGICIRWWSEEQQSRLAPQAQPQIECVDLSPLTLEVAKWGAQERLELDWVTPPPESHWQQSVDLLRSLNALEGDRFELTAHGQNMAKLGLDPRLAQLLILGKRWQQSEVACQACALLSEGDPFTQQSSDFSNRLEWLNHAISAATRRPRAIYQQSYKQWLTRSQKLPLNSTAISVPDSSILGLLLAGAFADRIGMRLDQQADKVRFKLANGRIATLDKYDTNAQSDWLVALDIGGHQGQEADRIFLSQPLDIALSKTLLPHLFLARDHLEWSKQEGRLISELQNWIGKLCIQRKKASQLKPEQIRDAMLIQIRKAGLDSLPWDNDSLQLKARLQFAAQYDKQEQWPDMSDTGLLANLDDWLGPYLEGITTQAALNKLALKQILLDSLPWALQRRLADMVPEKLSVASGNQHTIDYSKQPPTLSVKLQEVFGMSRSPTVLGQSLKLELLSPAKRPLAVTLDLPFFWREAYPEVKKEMRGRYPKHPWPDDPMSAQATAKTKRALGQ